MRSEDRDQSSADTTASESDLPAVLTPEEAFGFLRVKRSAGYAAAARGEIPTFRVGRKLRVPRDRLIEMVNGPGKSVDAAETEALRDDASDFVLPNRLGNTPRRQRVAQPNDKRARD
jgi:excisionase family DNA binding protein